jgi:hypothetical protein
MKIQPEMTRTDPIPSPAAGVAHTAQEKGLRLPGYDPRTSPCRTADDTKGLLHFFYDRPIG